MKHINQPTQPLGRLVELVGDGAEFPDAVHRVSREYGLRPAEVESLESEYDRFSEMRG